MHSTAANDDCPRDSKHHHTGLRIVILIAPRVLNYLVAFYLIIIGVLGIINELD